MSYGIRVVSLAVMVVLAGLVASAPVAQLQAQEIEGESRIFDLSNLEKDDEVRKSVVRYEKALVELEKVAVQGRAKIQEALKAYEASPSRKTEALLIKANAEAVSLQFHAHKEFQMAAKEAGNAIEFVIGEMVKGKDVIREQVEGLVQEKVDCLSKAAEAERQLTALAARLEELVDENGELDPELDAMVRRLDWIRAQELERADDVDVVRMDVELDREEIAALVNELRRKKNNLKESEMVSIVKMDKLRWISENFDRALRNRQVRDSARSLVRLIPVNKIRLPETEYPRLPRRNSKQVKASSKEPNSASKRSLDILKRFKKGKASQVETSPKKKTSTAKSGRPSSTAG